MPKLGESWENWGDRVKIRRYDHSITTRRPRRCVIATDKAQSWAYCEDVVIEDDSLRAARGRAVGLGLEAVSPATGAALRVLAAAVGAKAVAEVGTGAGVSGLWLLRGMVASGVLTTIDTEAEHQNAARAAFAEAGIASARTRLITGRALDVLPRMASGAYDLVFIDGPVTEAAASTDHARRMLRPGGVLAVRGALWHDRVPDPARREEATVAMRELGKSIREDEQLISSLLPVGDGLLTAVRIR